MKNHEFRELVDQNLSGLVWDERKRQKVLHAISEEEKPVKKISTTFILVAAILCISVTALAAGLIFSPRYDAVRIANQTMEEKYGITADLLSLFYREVKENGDGTSTVTFSIPDTASFPTDRIGEYSVTVSGNKGTASWSKDGMNTSGGLSAEAYGTEQLQLLSYDYAGTMGKLRDMGIMPSPTENGVKSNPRLTSGDIEWTKEDQAEADRALAEAKAEDDERLAKIAKAESEGSLTMEKASAMGKDAVIQEYRLTEEQTNKLNYEPDSTYISYQNDQPLAHMLFWLWQKDGDTFTEKDGQYWVTINLKTEVIEDIIYDAGLAGNG